MELPARIHVYDEFLNEKEVLSKIIRGYLLYDCNGEFQDIVFDYDNLRIDIPLDIFLLELGKFLYSQKLKSLIEILDKAIEEEIDGGR
jgi:hypothetical protein